MKLLFFSDIHGNLPALEIAVKDACDVDGYIILGDVVNYGPWSNECVMMVENLQNCKKIRGNHEDFFIAGQCGCDNFLANKRSFVREFKFIQNLFRTLVSYIVSSYKRYLAKRAAKWTSS